MSDLDEAGFHRQVKTCLEETVYPREANSQSRRSTVLTGGFSRFATVRGMARSRVPTCAYDGAGRSLSITSNLNSDRTDFRYDEHGGMTKIPSFDPQTIERNRNAALGHRFRLGRGSLRHGVFPMGWTVQSSSTT